MIKINKRIFLFGIILLILGLIGCNQTTQEVTDNSLLKIKERGKLVVGGDPHFPPFRSTDDLGKFVGYDVDFAEEIASILGVELEIKKIPWTELFDNVKSKNVDIAISAITITEERSKEMLFSVPYFYAGQTIVVKKENEDIKLPEDLKDRKVGVQAGTTCEEAALEYTSQELVIKYQDYESIIKDLKEEKIDAMVLDVVGAFGFVKDDSEIKIVGEPFTEEYYGIATQKENHELIEEINKILREMKRDGRFNEINKKWLGDKE